MTDPTPAQIEWAARLLCAALDFDWDTDDLQDEMRLDARRFLAEMERQGVKVTGPRVAAEMAAADFSDSNGAGWEYMHDAAPVCPDHGDV